MAEVGVGAVEHAEVGEVGDGDAVEGVGAVGPDVGERAAVRAGDVDGVQELGGAEAGGVDQEVESLVCGEGGVFVGLVVGGGAAAAAVDDGAVVIDAADGAGFECDVGTCEGGIPVVGDEDALAADGVVGCESLAHVLVVVAFAGEGGEEFCAGVFLECGCPFGCFWRSDDGVEGFAEIHHTGADAGLDEGEVGIELLPPVGDVGIGSCDDPTGRALIDGQVGDERCDFRDDLHAGGTCVFIC